MLKHSKQRSTTKKITQLERATDVLYKKMLFYDVKAKLLLEKIVEENKKSDKARGDIEVWAYKELRKCDDIVIDCAHKLAPYQSPKLESIEVKKQVEHRYVMRTPSPIKDTNEWMRVTGANKIDHEANKIDDRKAYEEHLKRQLQDRPPQVYDYNEDEQIEDERRVTLN